MARKMDVESTTVESCVFKFAIQSVASQISSLTENPLKILTFSVTSLQRLGDRNLTSENTERGRTQSKNRREGTLKTTSKIAARIRYRKIRNFPSEADLPLENMSESSKKNLKAAKPPKIRENSSKSSSSSSSSSSSASFLEQSLITAGPLGALFDLKGYCQEIDSETTRVSIKDKEYAVAVVEFESFFKEGKALGLQLGNLEVMDDEATRVEYAVKSRRGEMAARRQDILDVGAEIQRLGLLLEDTDLDDETAAKLSDELRKQHKLRGHHRACLNELEAQQELTVIYYSREGAKGLLRPGIVTQLSFMDRPLVWCPYDPSNEEEGKKVPHQVVVSTACFLPLQFASTVQQSQGYQQWQLRSPKDVKLDLSNPSVVVIPTKGIYRVVVRINGGSASANSDHVGLHLNGAAIARHMVGLDTGQQVGAYLYALVDLKNGDRLQVFAQFSSNTNPKSEDNILFLEPINGIMACRYGSTVSNTSGYHSWNQKSEEYKVLGTLGTDSAFTVAKAGYYRVVVRINGASSAANADHIALHLNGAAIARHMVGIDTGHQIGAHLLEIVELKKGDRLNVYSQFSSGTSQAAIDNCFIIEPVNGLKVCRYVTTNSQNTGYVNWNSTLAEHKVVGSLREGSEFIAAQEGRYRVVVRMNAKNQGANDNCVALHLNGQMVARYMAGPARGYLCGAHLHDLLDLKKSDVLQVFVRFGGGFGAQAEFNDNIFMAKHVWMHFYTLITLPTARRISSSKADGVTAHRISSSKADGVIDSKFKFEAINKSLLLILNILLQP
eukprot:g11294.t1